MPTVEQKIELKKNLAQKVLKPGAISDLRERYMEREKQTQKDKDRLVNQMFASIPEHARAFFYITPKLVWAVVDHAEDINLFSRPDCCIDQKQLNRAVRALQKSWKGVVKVTYQCQTKERTESVKLTFEIL